MSDWALMPNPNYAGKPRLMEAACHDRTPFITVFCQCGNEMHIHESSIRPLVEIAARCNGCGELLLFPPDYLPGAFQQLRDEGWIR
jgi:ribosomal protein S27E